ncbi:serine/threonine-protein kinase PknB-like [Dreissena polymorpha]|nr:serine/threonine-protein kinase PknB-like [Dreissena polymorpha]
MTEVCRTCETSGKCVMMSNKDRAVWQQLRHKNLMSCLMSIHDPVTERFCLVFEFPGITLQDFVFRMFLAKSNVPELISWQVLSKLASVLIFLENNGILPWELCHPQNVVITQRGEIKLENLLLYLPVKDGSRYQTNTSKRMSPEQMKGESATAKTLVWGLGRILYEICARLPVKEPSVKTATPPLCYHQAVNCTKDLSRVMCECLRNNPSSRPTLQSLLERAERHVEVLAANTWNWRLESNLVTLMQCLDRLPFSGGFLR